MFFRDAVEMEGGTLLPVWGEGEGQWNNSAGREIEKPCLCYRKENTKGHERKAVEKERKERRLFMLSAYTEPGTHGFYTGVMCV